VQFALCFVICLEFGASPAWYSEQPPSTGAPKTKGRTDAPQTKGRSILSQLNPLNWGADTVQEWIETWRKFREELERTVRSVDAAWNELAARRLHAKLVDLSKQLTILPAAQTREVGNIDEYVTNPTPEGWSHIRLRLKNIFDKYKELVEILKNDSSDFIIGPLYKRLYDTLDQRVQFLESLNAMPQPVKKEQLDQLRLINERYKRLIEEMNNARTALDEALEKQKTRSTSKTQ
jgi:hypothetical protein